MNFEIIYEKRKVKVREDEIEFIEKVMIDKETGEDIYNRELEIENTNNLYDIYRERHNLCSSKDIENIRKKYELNQTDYSLILGFGKITIHRYENGCLQNAAQDLIIKKSSYIDEMEKMLELNKDKISNEVYEKLKLRLTKLKEKEKKLIKINSYKKVYSSVANVISNFIMDKDSCDIKNKKISIV